MDGAQGPAALDSGNDNTPTFEELAADPEIAALLEFEPVPRMRKRREGWTAPLQRRFIAELTQSGSPTLAAEALDKKLFSAKRLYQTAGADSFRAAWDGAVALFEERAAGRIHADHAGLAALKPPMVDRRRTRGPHPHAGEGTPGQILNEEGEWEDAEFARRPRRGRARQRRGQAAPRPPALSDGDQRPPRQPRRV